MKGSFVAKKKSPVKKAVKKSSKKAEKKAPKKAVKKTVKKTTQKPAKAALKKAVKTAAKKSSKKPLAKIKAKPQKAAVKKSSAKASQTSKSAPKKAEKKVTTASPRKALTDLSQFVTPLDDRLIVQVAMAETQTPGGLYIPDTVVQSSGNVRGRVLAVGRGHRNKKGYVRPMDVEVGDTVVFPEYSGSKIKIQNEDLIILREEDVMGVVSK